jgi:hypothetical protein
MSERRCPRRLLGLIRRQLHTKARFPFKAPNQRKLALTLLFQTPR